MHYKIKAEGVKKVLGNGKSQSKGKHWAINANKTLKKTIK